MNSRMIIQMRFIVSIAIMLFCLVIFPPMTVCADNTTAFGAGRANGIYNRPTGSNKLPQVSATEVFGEKIGKPLDDMGRGVQNTYNNVSNFVQGVLNPKPNSEPPTPIQRDLKESLNFGNTVSTNAYAEAGGKLVQAVTNSPGAGNLANGMIGGAGDVLTVGSDTVELFNGGTTGYDSDSMNMFADGLTGAHTAATVNKYVAKAAGNEAAAKTMETSGNIIGVGKEIMKSETMKDMVNKGMEKNGNPFWLDDMKIRAGHVPQAMITGVAADPETTGAYILYGNKRDGKMDSFLNQRFFNSKAKQESKAIQEARAKAQAARAKRQGQQNQRGKKNISEGKPVIYLYPTDTMEIEVAFAYPEELTEVIPDYDGKWRVYARPDGTLTDTDGQQYEYLFYESETPTYFFQTEEGFYLPVEDRERILYEILITYDLNQAEAEGFVEYWCEYLEEDVPYRMYPQLNEIVDEAMPITITPAPESILRIWMLFEEDGESDETLMREPDVQPFVRNGFSVVEWGGMVR